MLLRTRRRLPASSSLAFHPVPRHGCTRSSTKVWMARRDAAGVRLLTRNGIN
jgi:hypothetical protein